MTPQPLRIALLALASLPAAASAQSVSTNLALGEAILLTSADYDVASGELTVRGTLTGLTSPVSQYRVLVQGRSVTPRSRSRRRGTSPGPRPR